MPTKLWLRSCLEKLILLRFLCIVQDGGKPSRVATARRCRGQWVAGGVVVLLACTLDLNAPEESNGRISRSRSDAKMPGNMILDYVSDDICNEDNWSWIRHTFHLVCCQFSQDALIVWTTMTVSRYRYIIDWTSRMRNAPIFDSNPLLPNDFKRNR